AFLALPKAKLDFLLDPANVAVLREVLLHHVVTGEVMAKDLNTASYSALDGTLLDVVVRTSGITIDGARVTMADVDATNGVVHAVSSVLVPDDVVIGS
ncbi:MAG: fasciclin domain-containing protein, partial [Actinobacteria bacterium]|nr:fasciclin domain-containing protein [Actinomycetota bacterium]